MSSITTFQLCIIFNDFTLSLMSYFGSNTSLSKYTITRNKAWTRHVLNMKLNDMTNYNLRGEGTILPDYNCHTESVKSRFEKRRQRAIATTIWTQYNWNFETWIWFNYHYKKLNHSCGCKCYMAFFVQFSKLFDQSKMCLSTTYAYQMMYLWCVSRHQRSYLKSHLL